MVYFLLILGLLILLVGGKFLVDGASAIALRYGLSPGLIGLTIVAFGTSAPELLVSISAALKGSSDIAIGNVIGSNISNISLVLGISAIVYPIVIYKSILKLDYLAMLISSILFFLLSMDNEISRIEGGIFVVLLVLLNLYFFKKLKVSDEDLIPVDIVQMKLFKAVGLLLVGIVGLYFGADMFVSNAVEISRVFGVSERVIGVTVIAIGTSLPELVTSIIAAINKKTDIAIGNILGSNIMNVLAIIGITSLVQPITVNDSFLTQDFIWMLAITILLFPILLTRLRISRIEGSILVLFYGTYLFLLI